MSVIHRSLFDPDVLGRRAWVWALPVLALAVFLHGTRVPFDNEPLYLVAAYRFWHPEFVPDDWFFNGPRQHLIFNLVAGLPMRWVSLEVVGWVGRVLGWFAVFVGLVRIGGHFRLPPWMAALATALWLITGQSVVGGEWIVRGFEAKVVAYPLLLFAIDAFLAGRDRRGAVLLGLSFSFHISVGLCAVFAVGAALALSGRSRKEVATIAGWTALFALPGVLSQAVLVLDSVGAGREAWRFVSVVALPFHLDPLSFPRRDILLLVLMFGFVAWRSVRAPMDRTLRFTGLFLGGLAVVALGGVVARLAGWYELLQVIPFRLLPVFAPILFFLHLAQVYADRRARDVEPVGAFLALTALMLTNPIGNVETALRHRQQSWAAPSDPTRTALLWLREHAEPDATIITGPSVRDAVYWSRRAHIGTLLDPAMGRLPGWQARTEALLGGDVPLKAMGTGTATRRFEALTPVQIEEIARRFGGDYLVTRSAYPYQEVFRVDDIRVFRVPQANGQGVTSTPAPELPPAR